LLNIERRIFVSTNTLLEIIKSRRSIRSYQDKPISEEALQTLLEAATYAPTAMNVQPWKFTLVTNKNELKRFSKASKLARLQALPNIADEKLERSKNALKNPLFDMFYGAPLLVFISGGQSLFAVNDCSLAAQNMMLAAYTLGIGSCWIGGAVLYANSSNGKAELGVPDDHQVYAAIIFGYPKGGFPKAPEKQPPQILKRVE
jgi:nitroreductase